MEFQRAKGKRTLREMDSQPAQEKDLAELAAMIFDSELGRKYYPTENAAGKNAGGLSNSDRIMVVREKEKNLRHVMVSDEGAFGMYPYLHLILSDSMKETAWDGADALS